MTRKDVIIKDLKNCIPICSLLAFSAGLLLGANGGAYNRVQELYPISAEVININEAEDTVTIESTNGHRYVFEGIEDWNIGDKCACIMDDNGTQKTVKDDIIVKIKYMAE